jgi:uncharacterized protein YegP (UPF0339 family)
MRVTLYKDRRGEWRWRIRSKNGRIVDSSSEGFRRRGTALRNLALTADAIRVFLAPG